MKEKKKKVQVRLALSPFWESFEEHIDGLKLNIHVRTMSISYQNLKVGKKRKIYAYSHGATTFSLTPFSCPWDSFTAGYIWTNSDRLAQWVVSEMTRYSTGDNYTLYDPETDEHYCEDSYAVCVKYAEENNLEIISE